MGVSLSKVSVPLYFRVTPSKGNSSRMGHRKGKDKARCCATPRAGPRCAADGSDYQLHCGSSGHPGSPECRGLEWPEPAAEGFVQGDTAEAGLLWRGVAKTKSRVRMAPFLG